jgi:hypothetical protein
MKRFKDNLSSSTNQIVQSKTTQDYFNQLNCPHMYGTCFGTYLDHPQERQYKAHIQEDKIKNLSERKKVPLRLSLFLPVYVICTDMPEDDLNTGQNM